jgi:hypothetical protein
MLEERGDEGERLIDKSQAIEHHGFDGFPHGEVSHYRVLVSRSVEDLTNAEFVEHASDKPRGSKICLWYVGGECYPYIANNKGFIPNYGERYLYGESASALVLSNRQSTR